MLVIYVIGDETAGKKAVVLVVIPAAAVLQIELGGRALDTDAPDSTFTNSNWAIAATYANTWGDKWAYGMSVKHIRESMDTFTANATA